MGKLIDVDKLELEPDAQGGMNGVLFCGRSCGKTVKLVQEALKRMIDSAPTVDAVPVVHGRWEPVKYNAHCSCGKSYGTYHYLCSACNRIAYAQPYGLSYCPNCGAKMEKEE